MKFGFLALLPSSAARFLLAVGLVIALTARGVGADKQLRPSLENYLKRIGYEPVALNRNDDNKLMVRGQLGGKARIFMVDTGWSVTSVDTGAARKLKKLGDAGGTLEDSFLGKLTDPSIVLLDGLKLGRATFLNQPAYVQVLQAGKHVVANGILGCDFLYRNYALIDCMDRRLYVRGTELPGEKQQALQETLRRSGFLEVNLNVRRNLVMTCEAEANDQPVRLLVDTGAIWSVLDHSEVKRLGLRPELTPADIVGVGKIGSESLRIATLKSVKLGDLTLSNVRLGVAELSAWGIAEKKRGMQDVQGILAADQLALNGALIDCRRLKLWLQPPK